MVFEDDSTETTTAQPWHIVQLNATISRTQKLDANLSSQTRDSTCIEACARMAESLLVAVFPLPTRQFLEYKIRFWCLTFNYELLIFYYLLHRILNRSLKERIDSC